MATTTPPKIKRPKTERVFGIVRVSEQGKREDERFHSPENQLDQLRAKCKSGNQVLVDYDPEINVSGGLALEDRPALAKAVLAVEEGTADVIMAPALDRLVRNRRVQDEVRDRVQAAGGRLVAVDLGEITNASPEQDFGYGVIGDANELMRKQISVKTKRGHKRAVELGRNIGPTPPGYRIGEDRQAGARPAEGRGGARGVQASRWRRTLYGSCRLSREARHRPDPAWCAQDARQPGVPRRDPPRGATEPQGTPADR